MASTPIYNWPTPDNTDLVKNGALSLRTLGGAIDTTVDKMIPETIFAAKGDLLGASANDTPAVLTVGANGETLVADSSTTTGLRWQAPTTLNTIINGGMDVWQRATSGTATASVYYTADRWYVYAVTNSPFARSTSVPTSAGCQYSLEVTGATSGTDIYIGQRIESANIPPIKGTVTVSAYIYNETGASVTPTLRLDRPQAVDNYSAADQTSYTLQACANNAWTRVTQTVDISALSNIDNGLAIIFFGWTMSSNTKKIRITGVKIEKGSVATQFVRSAGTIQGELAACQRYYWRFGAHSGGTAGAFQQYGITGYVSLTTQALVQMMYPVRMRAPPTSIDFANISINDQNNTTFAISALTFNAQNDSSGGFVATIAGATANRFCTIQNNNNTGGYLGISAEL
jgi:hypothetical protein